MSGWRWRVVEQVNFVTYEDNPLWFGCGILLILGINKQLGENSQCVKKLSLTGWAG